MNLKEKLQSVDPSKKCLSFLADRIYSNNYRGMQISQHNRYTVDEVIVMLEELYNLVGTSRMAIRTADLSKRPNNIPDEAVYATYTSNVVHKMGRGTQDTIRKNHFVDFHRMGFIDRFDANGCEIDPYEKRSVKYVALTQLGVDIIKNKNNTFDKNFIYTKAIDRLSHGLANDLLNITINFEQTNISIYEFMFFVSFMGEKLNNHTYSRGEVTEFVRQYRSMSKFQKSAVVNIVQEYCNPNNFAGDKTNKRDFGNWKNEAQQIFMLMNQTVLFEQGSGRYSHLLFLKTGDNSLFDTDAKLRRSKKAKDDYFIKHEVSKTEGFELHHVIPLLMARNKLEFDSLDVWQNLIYIDGFTHSKISQANNKNIVMSFENNNIKLQAIARNISTIVCIKDKNVIYSTNNMETMQRFNTNTLNSI